MAPFSQWLCKVHQFFLRWWPSLLQSFVALREAHLGAGSFLRLTTPIAPPPYGRGAWEVNLVHHQPMLHPSPKFHKSWPDSFFIILLTDRLSDKQMVVKPYLLWWRNKKKLGPLFHRHPVDSCWGHIELWKNAGCQLLLKNAYMVTEFWSFGPVYNKQIWVCGMLDYRLLAFEALMKQVFGEFRLVTS